MKYLEVTFTTHPCNETVNDVVSALAGDIGFESFVECEGGIQAYIQQALFNKEVLDEMISEFPIPNAKVEYTVKEKIKTGMKNGKRISSNLSLSVTVVAFTVLFTRILRKQSTKY
jgi:hypothetical protein